MIEELNKILDVKLDFDLSNYNTYKLESTAKVFLSIKNTEELKKVIDVLDKYKSKWFVIGNGSNIILPSYYNGVVIKLEGFDNYEIKDDNISLIIASFNKVEGWTYIHDLITYSKMFEGYIKDYPLYQKYLK